LLDKNQLLNRCPAELRERITFSRSLRELTTLQVGGPAWAVCEVRTPEEAQRFQDISQQLQTPLYVLGTGSNVLADDRGYQGLVLHMAADDFTATADTVTAGAGLSFDELIVRALDSGLTGLEFASGIPGTLGGALVGNAGCYGHEIGEFLVEAVVLDRNGVLDRIGPGDFGFAYRRTALRESGSIVLEATLRLQRGDVDQAARIRAGKIADRRDKHPVNLPSAGSWFRNLPAETPGGRRRPAGHYLELAGVKEMAEGDAKVFAGHANMIVNTGRATSGQILTLADRMRRAVRDRFGIELETEVRYLAPERAI